MMRSVLVWSFNVLFFVCGGIIAVRWGWWLMTAIASTSDWMLGVLALGGFAGAMTVELLWPARTVITVKEEIDE